MEDSVRGGYMDRKEFRKGKTLGVVGLAVLFTLVFCIGFVFFYTREQRDAASQPQVGIGHPLPFASLIDSSNQSLSDSELRSGKVILVFLTPECDACLKDSEFLKGIVGM